MAKLVNALDLGSNFLGLRVQIPLLVILKITSLMVEYIAYNDNVNGSSPLLFNKTMNFL